MKGQEVSIIKNKFASPPYLELYDKEKARLLQQIFRFIGKCTYIKGYSVEGISHQLEELMRRPSRIRKCDLPWMKELVSLINSLTVDATTCYLEDIKGV